MSRMIGVMAVAAFVFGCTSEESAEAIQPDEATLEAFQVDEIAVFEEPWAIAELPDGRLIVTEQRGQMRIVDLSAQEPVIGTISGVPTVDYGGQGGLGDIVPHPDFADNALLYFSYAEAGPSDTRGAVVARGRLQCAAATDCSLADVETIWRQTPKTGRRGHYGHRIAFSPDGFLFISSGDRQQGAPAQDLDNTLGTIVRLNEDGSVPADNPLFERGGATAQIWAYGIRNPLGLAFAPDGRLWEIEHGPAGGDEVNLIVPGANYGWPTVSNGDHYDGRTIPDHSSDPSFTAPRVSWTPVIAPGDMIVYDGSMFPQWQGDILATGMLSRGLVRLEIEGEEVREAARYSVGQAIRSIEQGRDGALWLLEDERGDSRGRLLRLTPAN